MTKALFILVVYSLTSLLFSDLLTNCNRSFTMCLMYTVKTLPEFDTWLDGLKDRETRLRLSRRLDKMQRGNLGDGDKNSQESDIAKAKQRKSLLED